MLGQLIAGIWLGLISGSLCVGCWAVLLPMVVSQGRGGLKSSAGVFVQFTLGRLVSYTLFGVVVGFAGSQLTDITWVTTAAYAAFE